MGQSVTIACADGWSMADFRIFMSPLARGEEVRLTTCLDQLQLLASDGRMLVSVNEVIDPALAVEDYGTNERLDDDFRRAVGSLRFFIVRFSDLNMVRRLLRGLAESIERRAQDAWIDTEYGWVIHTRDFLRRTDEDPGWDWRYKRHHD